MAKIVNRKGLNSATVRLFVWRNKEAPWGWNYTNPFYIFPFFMSRPFLDHLNNAAYLSFIIQTLPKKTKNEPFVNQRSGVTTQNDARCEKPMAATFGLKLSHFWSVDSYVTKNILDSKHSWLKTLLTQNIVDSKQCWLKRRWLNVLTLSQKSAKFSQLLHQFLFLRLFKRFLWRPPTAAPGTAAPSSSTGFNGHPSFPH